jgi:hypothetical protein
MSNRQGMEGRGEKGRSAAQRQGNATMTRVMKAWEELSDKERLTWEVAGTSRRTNGIKRFKQVNLRRLGLGEELARVPPRSKPYDGEPLLKRLNIHNRDGRITLELELWRAPAAPWTVWGSPPSNLGVKRPRQCPRLGWLPALQGGRSVISGLYFKRYSEYIKEHGLQLVGKRIFIRLRQEVDVGMCLYEEVKAVVPKPEGQEGKKGLSSSKDLRRPFEGSSKVLRNHTRTSRVHHVCSARATRLQHARGWRAGSVAKA